MNYAVQSEIPSSKFSSFNLTFFISTKTFLSRFFANTTKEQTRTGVTQHSYGQKVSNAALTPDNGSGLGGQRSWQKGDKVQGFLVVKLNESKTQKGAVSTMHLQCASFQRSRLEQKHNALSQAGAAATQQQRYVNRCEQWTFCTRNNQCSYGADRKRMFCIKAGGDV